MNNIIGVVQKKDIRPLSINTITINGVRLLLNMSGSHLHPSASGIVSEAAVVKLAEHGNRVLVDEKDFVYHCRGSHNEKEYWICSKGRGINECSVRVHTVTENDVTRIVSRKHKHSHAAQPPPPLYEKAEILSYVYRANPLRKLVDYKGYTYRHEKKYDYKERKTGKQRWRCTLEHECYVYVYIVTENYVTKIVQRLLKAHNHSPQKIRQHSEQQISQDLSHPQNSEVSNESHLKTLFLLRYLILKTMKLPMNLILKTLFLLHYLNLKTMKLPMNLILKTLFLLHYLNLKTMKLPMNLILKTLFLLHFYIVRGSDL
jgi:hypothetical protein